MKQAHILKSDGKGGYTLIGPGPVNKIRAEAAKIESGLLYIDGYRPRKLGTQSHTAYFALVAKENAAMLEKAKKEIEAQKVKPQPPQAAPKPADEKKHKEALKAKETVKAEAQKQLNK